MNAFSLTNKLRATFLMLLVLLSTLAVVPMTGCGTATLIADAQAVANACLSIAKIEQTASPTLADNLTAAANALIAATTGWTSGSPTAIINDAAIVVQAALAAIPETAAIAPLIPIAIAALDIILANTQPSPAPSAAVLQARAAAATNPYAPTAKAIESALNHRSFTHWTKTGNLRPAFTSMWNKTAKSTPGLASAVIP